MSSDHKQQGSLIRTLYLGSAVVLVVSSVIGSGVFKKVAPMAAELGSPLLVLLCWLLAGLITLFGALSNAEIAGMFAGSGGEYIYFKRIYGRFMAFLYGWSVFAVIKTAAVSSIAYVFAQSFNSMVPLPHLSVSLENIELLGAFKPLENIGVKLFTILLIVSLTFLNTRGLKGGARFSSLITALVIAGLLLTVLSGLIFGGGTLQNITTPSETYVPRKWTDFSFIKALFASMLAAFWAYEGWNTIGFLGGEIHHPNKNIPRALFGGMAVIITTYLLVNFTYLYVLPMDDMMDVYHSRNEIAGVTVIRHFAGHTGALILSLLILVTTLGCTNSTIIMPPRIYQVMAKDRLFFKGVIDIHPRYNTPNKALWLQGFWASVLVLSGSFDQLTDMLIFVVFFFYGATTLGVFIMRYREPALERPYRVWGYPFIPALFVLFCVLLVIITCFTNPREAGIGLLLVLAGIPFYWYWRRRKNDGEMG
ncbi:MAG: amino acid permease [Bacteroidales bacterium]|nr:amino acid permease [Bacteroidales bacterium]